MARVGVDIELYVRTGNRFLNHDVHQYSNFNACLDLLCLIFTMAVMGLVAEQQLVFWADGFSMKISTMNWTIRRNQRNTRKWSFATEKHQHPLSITRFASSHASWSA